MSESKRYEDWVRRLDAYFLSTARKRFSYGVNDCSTFAAGAIKAISGIDMSEDFKGKYHDAETAEAFIASNGGLTALVSSVATKHGLIARESKHHAQRGDIVVFQNVTDEALGVVALDGLYILLPGDAGLVRVKLSRALDAWGVA